MVPICHRHDHRLFRNDRRHADLYGCRCECGIVLRVAAIVDAIGHPNASMRYGVWAMKTLHRSIARRLPAQGTEPCGGWTEEHGGWKPVGAPPWPHRGPHCSAFCLQAHPSASERAPRPASRCFPSASPTPVQRPGKQKAAPKDRSKSVISLRKSGAGEGIRTLDPNLGKVVLPEIFGAKQNGPILTQTGLIISEARERI